MVVKPEQDRVRTLLTDTVTLLCKNGLTFSKEMKVQGTLGITLDENDVLLIHINEVFAEVAKEIPTIDFPASLMLDNNSESTSSKKRRKRRGSRDSESGSATPSKRNRDTNSHESHEVRVKEEKQEDVICLEDNDEADIKPHPLREASFSSFAQMDQNNQQYSSGMLQQSQNSVPSQMSDNSNASWDGSSSSQLPHMTPYKGVPGMQGGTPGSGEPWNAADPNYPASFLYPMNRKGAENAMYECRVPGCGKKFVHETHTRRHERNFHNFYRKRRCNSFGVPLFPTDAYFEVSAHEQRNNRIHPENNRINSSEDCSPHDMEQAQSMEGTIRHDWRNNVMAQDTTEEEEEDTAVNNESSTQNSSTRNSSTQNNIITIEEGNTVGIEALGEAGKEIQGEIAKLEKDLELREENEESMDEWGGRVHVISE